MATVKSRKEIESGLNKEQLEAVGHGEGPCLIIAGAGTGKTRVVTHRIAHLIERGVNPSRILALTFTDKAATEMEERVDRLVPYGYSTVWISTFHSFGDRVLRDNALSIGLVPDFKVLNIAECAIFLKGHLYEFPLDYYRPSGDPTRYLSSFIRFVARLKDEDISPEDYMEYVERLEKSDALSDYKKEQRELALAYSKYRELMAKNGYVDFGDQVFLTLKLFRTRPNILKRYQEKFAYILADEFQDTNYAQFELLKLLAKEERNITVVADDDQSIYKFRGAAISNVLNFSEGFPDAKDITLVRNYRSIQPILDYSYRLITHNNPDRLEVKRGIDKRLISARAFTPCAGGGVKHLHFGAVTDEAEFVAKTILDENSRNGGRPYRDFAVLVRANSDAGPFLKALANRQIKYRFSGSSGLYSRQEIRLLISLLNVISDHTDNLNMFHLASSPPYSLTAEDLTPCNNLAKRRHRSLVNVMKDIANGECASLELTEEGVNKIKRLVSDTNRLSELSLSCPTAKILYLFLTETGYLTELSQKQTEESEEKVRNIARFFELVVDIEETLSIKNVHAFAEHLKLLMEAGDDPSTHEPDMDEDCVHVLTVHKSKGLEFPVVFMVGLASDRFPRRGRKEEIEVPTELVKDILPSGDFHLEEERRLFYVGMTRAMDCLYLTSASNYGGVRAKKISRFVLEAMDMPQAETVKKDPKEVIERFAPVIKPEGKPAALPEDSVLHMSYYQIDDYLTCPLKYRYVHILKIPLLPHHTIMYGKAIHDAISHYLRVKTAKKGMDEGELLQVFRSSWRSEGFISKEHEEKRFEEGRGALRRFLEREKAGGINPVSIERDFSVDLGKDIIRGRWDVIEEREGEPYIIDFKTSDVRDKKRADKRAKDSLQLKLYALSYLRHMGRMPAGCELYFVDSGVIGEAKFDDSDINGTLELIDGVSEGIRKRDFSARPAYINCNWCAFNNICPAKAT